MQRHSFDALRSTFTVDVEYELVKELGQGASGLVIAARHKKSGQECAIKKITNIDAKSKLTKQCLREIKLLHHFREHRNIICLYDMDVVIRPDGDFSEVYLYIIRGQEELMEADLHSIIRSGQPLTDDHLQSLLYQTLCGLKYIHSANVLHRNIKPGNLLVNSDCELKICDFGLARGYVPGSGTSKSGENAGFMTEYVAMRWYHAPETLCSFANYTAAIDIWSVGCVLAELLGGKPIFKGRSYVDQLNQILHYLGTPSEETLGRVGSPIAQEYIRSLPNKPRVSFATLYPRANPLAIDLLTQMLCFDPAWRTSCEQALDHPYLQVWHDPADEPDCKVKFDSSFEGEESIPGIKKLIVEEVSSFRREVHAPASAAEQPHSQDIGPTLAWEKTISSPIGGREGLPELTPSSIRLSTPAGGDLGNDTDMSLSGASMSTTRSTIHPHSDTASVYVQLTVSSAPPGGSVLGAAPGAHDSIAVASAQIDMDSSLDYPAIDTLHNDLTAQVTRDGHDPVASGGFADIYRGVLRANDNSTGVAIKAIKMYSGDGGDFAKKQKRLRREVKVWLDLRHVNVLPLLGTTMGFGRFPAMVCPWAENGTLTSYLEDHYGSLSPASILSLLDNVASGLHYLHSCFVVHGDLSGSNVLIYGDGRACIADFGLSMLLTELGASTFATSFHARGTLRWTAPELLDLEIPEEGMEEEAPRGAPTTQSDAYSFGSIMLQILSGKVPYHYYTREAQVIHAVSRGMTPKRPSVELVTDCLWTFVERCWSSIDARRSRPSSEEITQFAAAELARFGGM